MLIFILLLIITPIIGSLSLYTFTYESNISNITFDLNLIRLLFTLTVLVVALIVSIFAKFYISGTTTIKDFYLWFNLFILSIIILLVSYSWWILILGWEILGITSFWLVAFYGRFQAHNGRILTIITNRIGDLTIIFSLIYFFQTGNILNEINLLVLIFILVGVLSKSAQFPLFSWLPAAIRAPTPVSALVHRSTLVTAGFALIIKFNWAHFINFKYRFIFGIITLFIGSAAALLECDFKKVVAFSTLSQLGFLIILFRSGKLIIVLYHLVAHAIFKRILFINVGVIIHQSFRNQSKIIFSRSLINNITHISWFYLSLINLSALPFLTGFYSKERGVVHSILDIPIITLITFILIVALTFSYSLRLILIIRTRSFSLLTPNHNKKFTTYTSLISWPLLCTLGYIWRINFANIELNHHSVIVVIILIGFVSYWLISVVQVFIFYHLTRFLQYNFSLNWVKNSAQIINIYKIINHPLIWINPTNWFIILVLILVTLF